MELDPQARKNEQESYRLLAELSPDERLKLLGEDFNLQKQLLRKRQYRRALASLSLADKLRLLEELRKRSQMQRGLRKAPDANQRSTVKAQTQESRHASLILRKPRPTRSKADLRRFGGRATAGGVGYEVRIAALIATKMLAGDRCIAWDGITGADIVAITLQAPERVDDIVVALRGESEPSVFISAKDRANTIALTAKSPAFAGTVTAFVSQFLKLSSAARARSRLVWAIPSTAGTSATRDLPFVLTSFMVGRFVSEGRLMR
jgi:hypothetical protein